MYASGRVWMEMAHEHGLSSSGAASKGHHKGCFVVWQMGLDPETKAVVFSPMEHIGDEECFVLELMVDNSILSRWSDSTAEIIKHRMLGFFSQRSGLLVRLEDTQLTRIQSPGAEAMY
ncbi:hypothetical protein Cni_G03503 [Canna indica]|uniref:Uncharacterized protein n=1 Tax=Canna indica TaxID=4628 RepID=A0AAQ3JSK2_9LILI|nr:hypothetical protein Cni_G03503 [Canna indica]